MFSPLFCESVIEPIGMTLLLGERICDVGMEEDGRDSRGRKGVRKQGRQSGLYKEQTWSLGSSLLTP